MHFYLAFKRSVGKIIVCAEVNIKSSTNDEQQKHNNSVKSKQYVIRRIKVVCAEVSARADPEDDDRLLLCLHSRADPLAPHAFKFCGAAGIVKALLDNCVY